MSVNRFVGRVAAALALMTAATAPLLPSAFAQAPGAAVSIPAAKLSLVPPSGYRRATAKDLPTPEARRAVAAFIGGKTAGFAANVNLMVQNAGGLKADVASADALGNQLKASMPTYKKVSSGALTVGGEKAAFLSGTFTLQKYTVQNKQVIIVHNNKGYIFTFSAAESAYAKEVGAFDKMVASIKWL